MDDRPNILELRNIDKHFPGVHALKGVNLSIRYGTVHALVGKNGAGKSTFTKIIAGVYPPTSGQIWFDGARRFFKIPSDAQAVGISTLYQELMLLPELSVAENILLGNEPQRPSLPIINWQEMNNRTQSVLEQIGFHFNPKTKVSALSVAQRQIVQIARAFNQSARLLVMDEPTSRLTEYEAENLFRIIRKLKLDGVATIFISHRLEEIHRICDFVTVMRDGQVVDTLNVEKTSPTTISNLMLGRTLTEQFPTRSSQTGRELLRVQGLTRYGFFQDIDFTLHRGEILGITGLIGAGGTALLHAIFGIDPIDEGQIYIDRRLTKISSPQEALTHGIGMLSEDRQEKGLVLDMGIGENINLAQLEEEPPGPLINHEQEAELAQHYIKAFGINVPYPNFKVRFLSGGNQQKVIVSKWMATGPRILLCDEPTQGIDIAAKVEIYRMMNDLAHQGVGNIMVSNDITEILNVCDRVLVLRHGQPVCNLRCPDTDRDMVLEYMMGGETKGD